MHSPGTCSASILSAFLRSKFHLPQGVQVLGGHSPTWLLTGRCPKRVNNPAGLVNKMWFPFSWKQSKRSISINLPVFILLPAHTMLHFIPLVWSLLMFAVLGIFSDNFYFLCEFTLFCCFPLCFHSVQKPQAPSLSKPVPAESRMSLKVDASAASGRIKSFFQGLAPDTATC